MYINSWEYMAGLFDGEGCIQLRKSQPRKANRSITPKYDLHVSIALTRSSDLLYRVRNTFGGSISEPNERNPKWKPIVIWDATTRDAYMFLKFIYPYLIIKKEEAKIAIDYYENNPTVYATKNGTPQGILDYRESVYKKLQELKRV